MIFNFVEVLLSSERFMFASRCHHGEQIFLFSIGCGHF